MTNRRVGAIDVGTNTVLLLVADGDFTSPTAVVEHAAVTRLGAGVDRTKRLDAAAIDRTVCALKRYAEVLRQSGVTHLDAVCTSAARDAENGADFLLLATEALGSRPRIIGGQEEAQLAFEGALTGIRMDGPVTVFDVGGGSTEIILGTSSDGQDGGVVASTGLDVGSVRLTERHIANDPPTAAELSAIRWDIGNALSTVSLAPTTTVVGVAGTVTTLAAIHQKPSVYDSALVHGSRLSRRVIERLAVELGALPLEAARSRACRRSGRTSSSQGRDAAERLDSNIFHARIFPVDE